MGGNKPDKGKKDGSCNVTACQAPLAGTMQGWMVNHIVHNGRLYYCEQCCHRFNEWDDRMIAAGQQELRRITWDETTGQTEEREVMRDLIVVTGPTSVADVFLRALEAEALRRLPPVPMVYRLSEPDMPLIRFSDYLIPATPEAKFGVNLHVGRYGNMPIPSGKRKKLKKRKRK